MHWSKRRLRHNLAIDAARAQQRRVENINAVGCHDDLGLYVRRSCDIKRTTRLDVLRSLKAVKLVEQLKHRALHLTVATTARLHTRRSDRVDLVHENNRGRVLAGKDFNLSILLHLPQHTAP